MNHILPIILLAAAGLFACSGGEEAAHDAGDGHVHEDGTTHDDAGETGEPAGAGDDHDDGEEHAHEETPIGTVNLGGHEVALAQGHGPVTAGEEAHLVVKLPYSDNGSTVVRAWLGTEDRTLSYVGKGEYAPSHDDYDVHATAPDPLPENVQWWIELEMPDGSTHVAAADPLLE